LADKPPLERIGHFIDNFEYKVAALVRQQTLQPIAIGARIKTHKEPDEEREEGIARLTEAAEGMGANAIIAMRFDTGEMMQMGTEICAYGTACKVTKL
jgi:uncharacterized protein YbjQ (UPF0145 family)